MRYAVGTTTAVEVVGSELLVCDGEGQSLHRLAGEGRRRFEQVLSDGLVELPDDEVTAALEAAGLLVPVGDPAEKVVGMSRRRALAIGAAAAAAGVVTVALPNAAAAQSGGPGPTTTTTTPASGPSASDFGYSLATVNNSLGILWLQGSYATSFNYDFTVTLDGNQVFSGQLASTTNPFGFSLVGNLGTGAGKAVVVSFQSLTTPVTTGSRSFATQ